MPAIMSMTELAAAPAVGDYLAIVDVSESTPANKNKRISVANLLSSVTDYTDEIFLSTNYASLSDFMTAYNADGANSTGNDGEVIAFNKKLLINNGYTGGIVNTAADHKKTNIQLYAETSSEVVFSSNYTRIPLSSTVKVNGGQHGNPIRVNLHNYSSYSGGNCGIYNHALDSPDATWSAAYHGENRTSGGTSIGLNLECSNYKTSGSMYGAVIHQSTWGRIAPAGGSPDLHTITDDEVQVNDDEYGIIIKGHRDEWNNVNYVNPTGWTDGDGYGWKYGIWLDAGALKSTGAAFYCESPARYGIRFASTAENEVADILLEGPSGYGIIFNGTYVNGAFKVIDDQKMVINTAGTRYMVYNSANDHLEFYAGATLRAFIDLSEGSDYEMNPTVP